MTDRQVNLEPVLDHLRRQTSSVDSIIALLDQQEHAIREQDIPAVMAAANTLQGEIIRRASLEQERDVLLTGGTGKHRHQLPAVRAPLVENLFGGVRQQRHSGVLPTAHFSHDAELIRRGSRDG